MKNLFLFLSIGVLLMADIAPRIGDTSAKTIPGCFIIAGVLFATSFAIGHRKSTHKPVQ